MIGLLRRFSGDDSGATAIEYGLIVGILAVVLIGGVAIFGRANGGVFSTVQSAFETHVGGG